MTLSELPETLQRAPQRRKVFDFIKAELSAGRSFPSAEQICTFMGWQQKGSATECLRTLAGMDRVLKETVISGTPRTARYAFSLKDTYR